ncbi:MAG: hypothetical protein ABIL45_03765 [candidate division WOR-3 bacterium]
MENEINILKEEILNIINKRLIRSKKKNTPRFYYFLFLKICINIIFKFFNSQQIKKTLLSHLIIVLNKYEFYYSIKRKTIFKLADLLAISKLAEINSYENLYEFYNLVLKTYENEINNLNIFEKLKNIKNKIELLKSLKFNKNITNFILKFIFIIILLLEFYQENKYFNSFIENSG